MAVLHAEADEEEGAEARGNSADQKRGLQAQEKALHGGTSLFDRERRGTVSRAVCGGQEKSTKRPFEALPFCPVLSGKARGLLALV